MLRDVVFLKDKFDLNQTLKSVDLATTTEASIEYNLILVINRLEEDQVQTLQSSNTIEDSPNE